MTLYFLVKWFHILSATVLFGTGLGTAFQMWTAHRSGDTRAVATVARNTVRADFLFTTPAVIVQPLTGFVLIRMTGADLWASWLIAAYALYILVGACWLPVVALQIRVRDLATAAAIEGAPLGAEYRRAMRLWFALGWPAFAGVLAIFWLMVAKPALW